MSVHIISYKGILSTLGVKAKSGYYTATGLTGLYGALIPGHRIGRLELKLICIKQGLKPTGLLPMNEE